MSAADLGEFLRRHVDRGTFPGAVLIVAEADRILAEERFGWAVVEPERVEVRRDTIFDLSSLTKPLVTALLTILLCDDGVVELDRPAARYVPEFRGDGREAIRISDLLLHRSGLPAWAPLYLGGGGAAGMFDRLVRLPIQSPPGERVVYSCPGYILLGEALARAAGQPLDRLFADRVAGPLGLRETGFRPPASRRRRVAATERGAGWERRMAGPAGDSFRGWREGMIWGEVHDGNARGLGGVGGNAGLFAPAGELLVLAREFTGAGSGLIGTPWLREFRRDRTRGLQEARSFGWQLAATPDCAAHRVLPDGSFGHTGFTGVSLWIEPDRGRIHLLLTNRIHPRARNIDMNAVRREFHRLAAGLPS